MSSVTLKGAECHMVVYEHRVLSASEGQAFGTLTFEIQSLYRLGLISPASG